MFKEVGNLQTVIETYQGLQTKSLNMSNGMMAMSSQIAGSTIVFLGFDSSRNIRTVSINIGSEPWEDAQIKALPKWSGAIVKMEYKEKLGPLSSQYFLTIIQGDEDYGDLFETVIQNLLDHLQLQESGNLFAIVYKVFERWKSFFKRGGFKKLSDEQQRGLLGELMLISRWIELNPGQPPLLIDSWNGPSKCRIDFAAQRSGIEIKTSIDKLRKSIRISNEKQLQVTDAVNRIYLYVFYLELSKTHGITLDEMVEKVREKLASYSQGLLLKFNDLLTELGFKDGEYSDLKYNIIEEEAYKVNEEFPQIKTSLLPLGINHVSYNVDLSHCQSYKIPVSDIYNLI
jgi:Putative  PD-(D/E)XK family member, (DUF4420)